MVTYPPPPSLYGKKGCFKVPFLFERERDLGNGLKERDGVSYLEVFYA